MPKEPRNYKLWLIAGLMVASTILFVIGVTLERRGEENHEVSTTHQESEDGQETQEAGQTHPEEAGETGSEEGDETHSEEVNETGSEEGDEAHSEEAGEAHAEEVGETHAEETVFGLNLESPWLVATAAIGSLALVAALLWFGHPVLIVIIPVVILMALLDIFEVLTQLGAGNMGIAILAAIIGLTRAAVAILAIVALREWRTSLRQAAT